MKDAQDIHICCILHNPGQTLWAICGQGIRDQAHKLGVTLSLRPAYADSDHLPELMDALHSEQVDAVVFGGGDFTIPQHLAASMSHIPFIGSLSAVEGAPIACNVQVDFRRAGMLAATYLIERMHEEANIIHIKGRPHGMYTTPRAQGFVDTVAQYPGMKIISEAYGNWDRESSSRIMQEALTHYPQMQAVYAHSDEMALGAQAVLEAAGRSDVVVVGVDAIPESLLAIRAGKMSATVNIAPYGMGRVAVTNACEIVQGRSVPSEVRTAVQLITAHNLHDAMFETVQVFPNLLRDVVEGHKAQRRLQAEIIAGQQALIRELSTPIIPVSNSILVVPLIGSIDPTRASQITTSVLEAVSKQSARVLIIDITGVSVVDTNVVNHLLQTARATLMLGAMVLLVGITPEVAQTVVQLGIDLSGIVTRSTLQTGLEYATNYLKANR